ncbi:hypothetical protein KSD_50100 [Ktedonobacter sp. SOSP1-85]|uniref:hypothetical protein n=1 Tax=Ktedonobacter sp. SOSP1-85 TaxID=2778367 RepID=UPI001915E31B|nr:hypothetical protein [Ktedonobacter sp. SOSP1-85]GHO77239.1 hypothetical protein KSD_50100 [Ktedonobacter sp. SOSP1-85]
MSTAYSTQATDKGMPHSSPCLKGQGHPAAFSVNGKHLLFDGSDPEYPIVCLTTTYHDIFGIKHVSVFDYINHGSKQHKWLHIATTSDIKYDLEELDDRIQPPQIQKKPIK